MKDKNEFEEMVNVIEEKLDEPEKGQVERSYSESDPEWSEYVLDQFHDSELKEGNPTVDGLRRVAEKMYGEILSSKSEVLELPSDKGRCTIKHSLTIRKYETSSVVEVDGCVDVKYGNIPSPFNEHLVATADTRAEGKALRRALKLRIVTAEEMNNSQEDDILDSDENITDQQILAINQMCKRLDINLTEFVKQGCPNVKSVRDVSNVQGRSSLSSLSSYQRDMSIIPEDQLGYDANWRETFDIGKKKK